MAPSVGLPQSLVDDVDTPDAARAAGRQSAPRSATAASLFYPVRLVLWLLRWMCCQVLVASGLGVCCCVCHLTAAESTRALAAASAEPDDNLLLRQKQHHQKAFGFISKALRYDDEKHALKELAIVLYSKGIEELQKGIAIEFSQEKGRTWQRARRLTDNIRANLQMARERLDFLPSLDREVCPESVWDWICHVGTTLDDSFSWRREESARGVFATVIPPNRFTVRLALCCSWESMVKIEHMGDDPPWHADVPRPPEGGQRLRAWQKTPPGQDAASANRDDSSWLKTAQNGRVAADGQSHDRPTSGDLKELAIGLYCKGIEDLQNGIATDFSQGKCDVTTFVAH